MDRRIRIPEDVRCALRAHGVAGLFLEPERALLSCSNRSRPGPRTSTAFHHAHLDEALFETIALLSGRRRGRKSDGAHPEDGQKDCPAGAGPGHAPRNEGFPLTAEDLVVSGQLDEMWPFIGKKRGHLEPIENLDGHLGDAWIWIAFDPTYKVVLAHVVGKRTEPYAAVALLQEVKRITVSMPGLFTSDQLDQYTQALLQFTGLPAFLHASQDRGDRPSPDSSHPMVSCTPKWSRSISRIKWPALPTK